MSETQRPSDVMPVLDDFLGTMAEDGIFTERSFPQQQVNALDVTGGQYHPFEITGRISAEHITDEFRRFGMGSPNSSGGVDSDPVRLMAAYGPMLPKDAMLLGFSSARIDGTEVNIVQQIDRTPNGIELTTFVKGLRGINGEARTGWVMLAYGFLVIEDSLEVMLPSQCLPDEPLATDHVETMVTQSFSLMVVLYLLYLLHHQAIEYRMGRSGPGQRRYNRNRQRDQAVIPLPRVIDLSKAKFERIPVIGRDRHGEPTGITMSPHDHTGYWRDLRDKRFVHKRGNGFGCGLTRSVAGQPSPGRPS